MPLPASGIISASQVGNYVFDRSTTAQFSLSASFSPSGNTQKVYSTTLGPLWVGNGVSDTNNAQYNIGPNNLTLASWYNYAKGQEISVTGQWETRIEACDDASEVAAYITEYAYWGLTDGISPGSTVVYTNTEGTSVLDSAGNFVGVYAIQGNNGKFSGYFDVNGIFQNEQRC